MKVLCYAKGDKIPQKVGRILSKGRESKLFTVSTRGSFQRELLTYEYDFVLIDFESFPEELEKVLAWFSGVGKKTPVLILVDEKNKEKVANYIDKGVVDYVLKSDLTHIGIILNKEKRERNLEKQAERMNQLIRESESRYGSIVESSQDAIMVVQSGRIVFANTMASRLSGYRGDELLGMEFSKIFFSLEGDREYILKKKGEGHLIIEASQGPITWLNKKATLLTIRDITQRKKAEGQLRTLYNFALDVSGILELEKLKKSLVRHLTPYIGRASLHFLLLLKKGGQIESWNVDGKTRETITIEKIPKTIEKFIKSNNPIEIQNVDLSGDWLPEVMKGKKWILFVPVRYQNLTMGSIILTKNNHTPFGEDVKELTMTFASEMAVAVENVKLFQNLKKALRDLEKSYQLTLETLVSSLDYREHETQFHSIRVARYATHLAEKLALDPKEIKYVYWGGLLHDIGKIGVPDSILLKPASLTPEEWEEMKKHPEIGYKIIRSIKFLGKARDVILFHHERWDGRGYPRGLKGEEIPMYARIFAFADTLDAITTDRPYRKARSFKEAIDEIVKNKASQFDPHITDVFLDIPIGDWIKIRREVLLESTSKINLVYKPKLVLKMENLIPEEK